MPGSSRARSGQLPEQAGPDVRSSTSAGDEATCRICWEGPRQSDSLLSPCACRGTAAHIHRSCLQDWQRTNFRNLRQRRKASHCDICGCCFHGPGVLQTPENRLRQLCRRCEGAFNKCFTVPLIGPSMTSCACTIILANAAAYALAYGLAAGHQGWIVGAWIAKRLYARYSGFLDMCDLFWWTHGLPLEWAMVERGVWHQILLGALIPTIICGGLGVALGASFGAIKGVIGTAELGAFIVGSIFKLSQQGLGGLCKFLVK